MAAQNQLFHSLSNLLRAHAAEQPEEKQAADEAGVKYEFQKEAYGFTVVFFRHCGEGWG